MRAEEKRRGAGRNRGLTCLKGTHVPPFKGQKTGENWPVGGGNWV